MEVLSRWNWTFSEDFWLRGLLPPWLKTSAAALEKMICRILLLISLNCVCGTFVVNVTQTSYQAEENHNITLEWTFTTTAEASTDFIFIFCEMKTDHKVSVLFHLRGGVEVLEFQDQQFVGRVQWDKDVLRDGRLRLHVSRLRTEDSGQYICDVRTKHGENSSECRLNVSAARDQPEPERPNTDTPERPDTASEEKIALYCGLTAAAVVVGLFVTFLFIHRLSGKQKSSRGCKKSSRSSGREEKHLSAL